MRARAGLSGLTLALGLLTACSGGEEAAPVPRYDPAVVPAPAATLDTSQLTFDASVEVVAAEVVVTWSVTNHTQAPVLVTNRVPDRRDGSLSERPDRTYVLPGREPGRVELAKRVLPASGDAAADARPSIGVSEVGPGRSLSEVVRVPLPLAAYGPPAPDYDDLALPEPATSVVFCLGILSGRDPAWGIREQDGIVTVEHGRAQEGQTTRCSEPVDLP
ncbi:hypothetical protein [Nocardioides sp. LML1-1-1.1]|uniref:hypothetical protein n=1 Tax=Nocardioides sp. LML1-1-1.1 TaxID=3135248 RepID=UPI00344117F4